MNMPISLAVSLAGKAAVELNNGLAFKLDSFLGGKAEIKSMAGLALDIKMGDGIGWEADLRKGVLLTRQVDGKWEMKVDGVKVEKKAPVNLQDETIVIENKEIKAKKTVVEVNEVEEILFI